jgi:hypothetical protein
MRSLLSVSLAAFVAFGVRSAAPVAADAQIALSVNRMQTPQYPTLLQGTPVMLLLDQTIDAEHSKVGQRVRFEVLHDVRLGDRLVIPAGALALGTVTQASRQSFLGRAARVRVAIAAVRLPGGQVVRLSFSPDEDENSKSNGDDVIGPGRGSADHGGDAKIAQGTEVRAFVRADTLLFQQMASVNCEPVTSGASALFGDAYAARWFPAFVELGRDHRTQLIQRNTPSCPAL